MNLHNQQSAFYFKTPELTHRHELILHLLEHSNHVILVHGEKGAGKTAFYSQLNAPIDSNLQVYKLNASNIVAESDILKSVIDDLDTWQTKKPSLEDFQLWLERCHSMRRTPALLIDDAHKLSNELIDYVFNVLAIPRTETTLHVCLFCEPDFNEQARDKLEEGAERDLHVLDMPKFNEQQTAYYLNEQYPEKDERFSILNEATVRDIQRISNGIPKKIKLLAEQYLNDPALHQVENNNETSLHSNVSHYRSIFTVMFVLLIVIVGGIYLIDLTGKEKETMQLEVALPEANKQVPAELPKLDIKTEKTAPVAEIDTNNLKTVEAVDEKLQQTEMIEETSPPVEQEQQTENETHDIAWLLEQNPTDYVVQLIGANEEKTLERYLSKFKISPELVMRFSTTNNNKPWHVLFYGHYPNREQAVLAIEKLPAEAKNLGAWPRSVKSIQALSVQ